MRSLYGPLIKMAAFLVVTALSFYVLAVTIANSSFGDTYTYKANFNDVTGLELNDGVRIAGVKVGSVSDMKLIRGKPGESSYTQVTFSVAKSRPLPTSAGAYLRYRNLIGQRYVEVEQGAGSDAGPMLKPGQTLGVDKDHPDGLYPDHDAVDLTVLFRSVPNLTNALDAPQINKLTYAIIQTLQGEGAGLENLIRTVADLTNSLADKDQVIGEVIDNLTSVLQTLGQRDSELSNLIIQLRNVVSGLAGDRKTIGNSIDGINNLATSTAGLLTKVRPPLKADVKSITGLVNNLNKNSGVVTYVLKQLAPTVAGLIRTASYGSWFNFYLCNLKVTAKVPGVTNLVTPSIPIDTASNAVRGCKQ